MNSNKKMKCGRLGCNAAGKGFGGHPTRRHSKSAKTAGIFFLGLLLAGCATKGGWPCWAWERNTDQKNEVAAEQYLQAQTNSPAQ